MTDAETKAAMELQKPPEDSLPQLTFDDATHTYRIDGVVVPSVTQILSEAGLIDDRWYTEESQLRGRTVHIITALDDRAELDESQVTDEYKGYLAAWRRFKTDTQCAILSIEHRICHVSYRYAGTVDRTFRWDGIVSIADIKTGGRDAWHPVQLAGYTACAPESVIQSYVIYLREAGDYQIGGPYGLMHSRDVFFGALVIANWKRNEGKTNDRYRSD